MMNEEYRITNKESGKNIPVLRTLGYYAVSYSTNITGALHLGFQHTGIAISETAAAPQNILTCNQRIWNEKPAAAPRNICRTACRSSERKVQPALSADRRTETLKRITAQDTCMLGNTVGDKKTKTNLKTEMKNKTRLAGLLAA